MLAVHGEEGLAWLERLPTILSSCERRWGLTLAPPFAPLSFHYAAPAMRADGVPVVVKACSPTGEFEREMEALQLFDGRGMVRLLDYHRDDKVLLLERLVTGTLLRRLENEEKPTFYAATVMRQ